jgi:hypothetical protein
MDPWHGERDMRTTPTFRAIGAIMPFFYCSGLLIYFIHQGGSVEGAISMGLGPTLLGLAIVDLLFSIPLIVVIFLIFRGRRLRRSDGHGGPSGPHDGEDAFDADAVVARYLARAPAQTYASPPAPSAGAAPKPTGFGRRSR